MYKTFKDINSIRFPVYRLPSTDWYSSDGVLFIDDGRVLDDKNMPGKTLGIRRIQCGRTDLYRLKRGYGNFNSMLQSNKTTFIDSNGVPFVYVKSVNSKLVYHMVLKIDRKESHSLVWLRGIHNPFSIPRPPIGDPIFARVLYFRGMPWAIYDFQASKGKDSRRRV